MELTAHGLSQRFFNQEEGIPFWLAAALLQFGYEDLVRRLARDGEWFCAECLARSLAGRGAVDEALGELEPYVATGWSMAVDTAVQLLERNGRVVEALGMVRRHAGADYQAEQAAKLLARADAVDEAVALLAPRIHQPRSAALLVEVTAGRGRDALVEGLLRAEVDRVQGIGPPMRSRAPLLLAEVLERSGRAAEAIAFLETRVGHPGSSVQMIDALARLFARDGREEQLRSFAADRGGWEAWRALVGLLIESGRVDEAERELRVLVADGLPRAPREYAEFLAARDRLEEAVEVMRPSLLARPDQAGDTRWLCGVLIDIGRVDEALALSAETVRAHPLRADVVSEHVRLLHRCGRSDEAVEQAQLYAAREPVDGVGVLAETLLEVRRFEEGLAVVEAAGGEWHDEITKGILLIANGHPDRAIAMVRGQRPEM